MAFVGSQKLTPFFDGKKFKKILFEGFFPFPRMQQEYCKDLLKILEEDGKILLNDSGNIIDLTKEFREADKEGVLSKNL